MADIRTLSYVAEGLDALRSELRFSERRLAARTETAHLAPPFGALVMQVMEVRDTQMALWDAEDDADVLVSNCDDDGDDLVDVTTRALNHHLGSREHPHYKRIFGGKPPSEIQHLGLESQSKVMADWPAALRAASPELAPLADQVQAMLDASRLALDARTHAAAARANHRVGPVRLAFEAANTLRLTTLAQLIVLGAASKMPKAWPKRFFRVTKPRKASSSDA